jgi:F-type H+-transporting ATPase subunit gamma
MRVYRQRIRTVQATKKITRAMELIAASRVVKAQQRVRESSPYARALTRAVSAVATFSNVDHPLTTEHEDVRRAAVLVVTSDRGLAGAYSSAVLKESERLVGDLRAEGKEVVPYLVGRKAVGFYRFRKREFADEWTGFTDQPTFEVAREIGETLVARFNQDYDEGGVDEVHIVFTRFVNMVTQTPDVIRMLPLEVVEGEEPPADDDVLPLYEFEPNAEQVLDALLPKYVSARIYNCLLQAAASELASRQRAMKSATDNAEELIKKYTRLANQARQAEITQEISEIVGGASALADAS